MGYNKTMTNYRAMGTTDEVTTCEICGKPELKGTVILAILDADGNREATVYAGATCAARRVGGNVTAKKIRDAASGANLKRRLAVEFSREIVDHYAPFAHNAYALAHAYAKANAGYFRNFPSADPMTMALESMSRHREVIATDGLCAL